MIAVLPASATQLPKSARDAIDAAFRHRAFARRTRRGGVATDAAATAGAPVQMVEPGALEVHDLEVRFGGIVGVDNLTLRAPTGRVTGLIGPNGAGKTTTFNACSGLNRPSRGRILLDGQDVSRLSPSARARRGLGRTFQKMELFDSITVWDNVVVGVEGSLAGANPLRHLARRRADASRVEHGVAQALALCGIEDLARVPVGTLSTGQRRLVELARCLAGPFRVLLLDEPSSGLDRTETACFGEILKRVVAERGIGILLVEHDMSLVLEVCDLVYVLDFGELVFEGTTDEVVRSPIVQAAYLGDAAVEEMTPLTGEEALR
jgi:ABC-type branched-subunit amino acid transport system ATPase component